MLARSVSVAYLSDPASLAREAWSRCVATGATFALGLVAAIAAAMLCARDACGAGTAVAIDARGAARDRAQRWLHDAQAARPDADGMLVALESEGVGVPPSAADYIARRQDAYALAAARAKSSIARQMAARIKADLQSESRLEQVIGDRELARALVGLASGDKSAAAKLGQELESLVTVAAEASLRGFSLAQTFEVVEGDRAEVAVVGVVSPSSQAWAKDGATVIERGEPLDDWLRDMPADVLCRTLGTRFVPDGAGRMHLVAFAQQQADAEGPLDEAARSVAEAASIGLASESIAVAVSATSWSRSVSSTKKVQDLKPEWTQVKSFLQSIESSSGDEAIRARVRTLLPRRVRDPIAERDVWVVASVAALGGAPPARRDATAACPDVPEEIASSIRQIDARGEGPTYEDAVRSALRDAIRQEGVFVESDQDLRREFVQQMSRVNEEVSRKSEVTTRGSERSRTFADGFIHSYAVIQGDPDGQARGRVAVRICANVVRFDPSNPRFGGVPTIAVLPAMVRAGAVKVDGRPIDAVGHARSVEAIVERCLADAPKRYRLLDSAGAPAVQAVRDDIRARAERGDVPPAELMKLGQQLTADYVVLVEVDRLEFTGAAGNFPEIRPDDVAVAEIRCRIVNVADGSVVPWNCRADVRLGFADGLGLPDRDEQERMMAPIDVARHRSERRIDESLRQFLGLPAVGAAAPRESTGAVRVVRVSATEVSLDASNPLVRVGARFLVENPVSVTVGGRVLIDRDRVAVIQVASIRDGIAKARAIEGDIDLIDPVSCELTPVR